jgi:hypothetical protein
MYPKHALGRSTAGFGRQNLVPSFAQLAKPPFCGLRT